MADVQPDQPQSAPPKKGISLAKLIGMIIVALLIIVAIILLVSSRASSRINSLVPNVTENGSVPLLLTLGQVGNATGATGWSGPKVLGPLSGIYGASVDGANYQNAPSESYSEYYYLGNNTSPIPDLQADVDVYRNDSFTELVFLNTTAQDNATPGWGSNLTTGIFDGINYTYIQGIYLMFPYKNSLITTTYEDAPLSIQQVDSLISYEIHNLDSPTPANTSNN